MAIWQTWTSSIKSFHVQQKWLVHLLWWGRLSSHAHSWGLWWQNPEQRTCLPHDPSQLISIIVSRLPSCLWSVAHSYSRGAVKGTAGFLRQVRELCIWVDVCCWVTGIYLFLMALLERLSDKRGTKAKVEGITECVFLTEQVRKHKIMWIKGHEHIDIK